jgi:hypothetical protein
MIHRSQPVKPLVPQQPVNAIRHEDQHNKHDQLHQHSHGNFQGKHFRPGSGPARQPRPRPRGPTGRRSPTLRSTNEDDSFDNYDPEEQDLAADKKSVQTNNEQKGDSQNPSDQQQQQQERQAKWKIKAAPKNQSVEPSDVSAGQAVKPAITHKSFASRASIQKHFASAALGAINSVRHAKSDASIRSQILPEMLAMLEAIDKDKSLLEKMEFSDVKELLVKLSKAVSSAQNSPAQESYRRLLPLLIHSTLGRRRTSEGFDIAKSKLKVFINSMNLTAQQAQPLAR